MNNPPNNYNVTLKIWAINILIRHNSGKTVKTALRRASCKVQDATGEILARLESMEVLSLTSVGPGFYL